ncbi:hypothetical protein [Shinella sp.]|uniref:hypothetical protein n=1 Tax=Shinella sp. TaxID=1870904 RepID=UPI0029A166E2|nr:hypothetical protein [Shinella sp.]MDX3974696.1 hypothetical protein [Shinella sp.]
MSRSFGSPGRYIQRRSEIARLGEHLAPLGSKPLVLIDADKRSAVYQGLAPCLWCGRKPDQPFGVKEAGRALLDRGCLNQPERTAACLHRRGCASSPMRQVKHISSTQARPWRREWGEVCQQKAPGGEAGVFVG